MSFHKFACHNTAGALGFVLFRLNILPCGLQHRIKPLV